MSLYSLLESERISEDLKFEMLCRITENLGGEINEEFINELDKSFNLFGHNINIKKNPPKRDAFDIAQEIHKDNHERHMAAKKAAENDKISREGADIHRSKLAEIKAKKNEGQGNGQISFLDKNGQIKPEHVAQNQTAPAGETSAQSKPTEDSNKSKKVFKVGNPETVNKVKRQGALAKLRDTARVNKINSQVPTGDVSTVSEIINRAKESKPEVEAKPETPEVKASVEAKPNKTSKTSKKTTKGKTVKGTLDNIADAVNSVRNKKITSVRKAAKAKAASKR